MLIRESHMVEQKNERKEVGDGVKKMLHFVCISGKHPPLRFVYSYLEEARKLLSFYFSLSILSVFQGKCVETENVIFFFQPGTEMN